MSRRPVTPVKPPRGWPSHVQYVTAPKHAPGMLQHIVVHPYPEADGVRSAAVAAAAVNANAGSTAALPSDIPIVDLSSLISGLTSIRTITDTTHPACGQQGLFAAKRLPPGSLVVPYLGLVHREEDADPSSDYDLSLDRELGLGIDAMRCGNEARFVNDFRGTPVGAPNAEFRDVYLKSKAALQRGIAVFVLPAGKKARSKAVGIPKGAEILVSYGKGFWARRHANDSTNDENDETEDARPEAEQS